ncbi:hypothetical protein AC579_404 [Pseudocercospora musae]|uniref:WAP domain-containing protein n=1 Tax=Pseudocercospora musae TaxID=113226 RepID=A0A139GYB9_9PEZI|nr:hypothetical protein AC579_404 [Pseudocercospora musae]
MKCASAVAAWFVFISQVAGLPSRRISPRFSIRGEPQFECYVITCDPFGDGNEQCTQWEGCSSGCSETSSTCLD